MKTESQCRVIAVTGASGFIGRAICNALGETDYEVRRLVRTTSKDFGSDIAVGEIGPTTEWRTLLHGVDFVIHAAAKVHVVNELGDDGRTGFQRVNAAGTRRLAEQAAQCGVKRLVFVSSIGVLGAKTDPGAPFSIDSVPAPIDPYALSKWEAEKALSEIAKDTGLEAVIVRPPLVYGRSAPGNFGRLVRLVELGIPLPLAGIRNLRSFVARDNLVDLLIRCVDHPAAAGRTFLVSDGVDLSIGDFIKGLAKAMGRPSRLFPVPERMLRSVAWVTGKLPEVEKMIGFLQVDTRYTFETLGWVPPISMEEALRGIGKGEE